MTSSRSATRVWLALALASCSQVHQSELGDSNTHWLKQCEQDGECGGLSCLCGVCSKDCGASGECRAFGASAVCVPGEGARCGDAPTAAPRLCDAMCDRDADCRDGALSCVDGRCRPALASPRQATDGGGASSFDAGSAGGVGSDASLAFICPPQRARSDGTECLRSEGFAWNGAACKEILCGCTGEDCAAIYPSRAACEAAHAAMCHPPTACDESWYQCNDVCPARWVLMGGGWNQAADCPVCRMELKLSPISVLDVGGCTSLNGQLGLAQRVEGDARVPIHRLARVGQHQAARGAAQEPHTEPLLEPLQTPADGGARYAQLPGGARQRLRVDDLREGQELRALEQFGHGSNPGK
jgi:hypothetical protein